MADAVSYPRIYLTWDNVAFYKRWCTPDEWAEKIADLNIRYVEASADNEHDPLFMGPDYFHAWIGQVRDAEHRHDIRVANLYSGHGTYSTLGMTHPDARVRENMMNNWFYPMVEAAGELGCGMGFFAHAFPHRVLQSQATYSEYVDLLVEQLVQLNRHAGEVGCRELGLEQMYTPHQYPWRINDTRELLRRVTQESGRNFYFTEDVGHHQRKFQRPSEGQYLTTPYPDLWLGSDKAFALARERGISAWPSIEEDMDKNPQLFASAKDCDCYQWLSELGCYSPIIHLQQTDGQTSAHILFTEKTNAWGIINPLKVLSALKASYDRPIDPGMPDRCTDIYLTLELYSGTASIIEQDWVGFEESARYWRNAIPEDGLPLDELVARLSDKA